MLNKNTILVTKLKKIYFIWSQKYAFFLLMITNNYFSQSLYGDLLIKGKNSKLFCTGCPKSAVRGGSIELLGKKFHMGHPRQEVEKKEEVLVMGRLKKF